MALADISVWVSFALTLFVYTYLIGDTFLYRLAVYIFAGLTTGFIAVITWDSVLLPWIEAMQTGGLGAVIFGLIPPLLALILLISPRVLPGIGLILRRLVLAFLIGVGAAVAVVGAVSGTLIPLATVSGQSIQRGLGIGILSLVGVISTLVYFQYSAQREADGAVRRGRVGRVVGAIGGAFVAVTLGTVYAAAIGSTLTVFTERMGFLLTQVFGG